LSPRPLYIVAAIILFSLLSWAQSANSPITEDFTSASAAPELSERTEETDYVRSG
jgi:hypothetical protein